MNGATKESKTVFKDAAVGRRSADRITRVVLFCAKCSVRRTWKLKWQQMVKTLNRLPTSRLAALLRETSDSSEARRALPHSNWRAGPISLRGNGHTQRSSGAATRA